MSKWAKLEFESTQRLLGAMVSMEMCDLSEEAEQKAQQLAFVANIGYEQRIRELERCLSEHHAAGALEGMRIGDACPICAELD